VKVFFPALRLKQVYSVSFLLYTLEEDTKFPSRTKQHVKYVACMF